LDSPGALSQTLLHEHSILAYDCQNQRPNHTAADWISNRRDHFVKTQFST